MSQHLTLKMIDFRNVVVKTSVTTSNSPTQETIHLAPVVERLDSTIHWINNCPLVNSTGFDVIYQTQGKVFHQISNYCEMWVEKNEAHLSFLTNFKVFGYLMNHSFSST